MTTAVAASVAEALSGPQSHTATRSIVWHGGEPLAVGIPHFERLLEPFAPLLNEGSVAHELQTNATLVDDEWCSLFRRHSFHVGVSIDGPSWANLRRRQWNNAPSFESAMRGIECLKENQIPFSAIAVVTKETISFPEDLYSFFSALGCSVLGLNLEEKEGINVARPALTDVEVRDFWARLFASWEEKPCLAIREFERVFRFLENALKQEKDSRNGWVIDIFPTVAWNGDVSVLSPELAETRSDTYENFVGGNVLRESLSSILHRLHETRYVVEFVEGIEKCGRECDYFQFCRGGQASNKFFETGAFNVTETEYCRNSKIRLMDSILEGIRA